MIAFLLALSTYLSTDTPTPTEERVTKTVTETTTEWRTMTETETITRHFTTTLKRQLPETVTTTVIDTIKASASSSYQMETQPTAPERPPPPPPAEDQEHANSTDIEGPVSPGGPPPSVATIGGEITGLKSGDYADITISAPDLGFQMVAHIVSNGPWSTTVPYAGRYLIRAEATGYTVQPKSYEIEIAEGEENLTLDFRFTDP